MIQQNYSICIDLFNRKNNLLSLKSKSYNMKFAILTILIISTFVMIFHVNDAFSLVSTCQSHIVCANPGNILKYDIVSGSITGSKTYNFDSMYDSDHIKIIEQDQVNQTQQNDTLNLNIRTGYVSSEQDPNTTVPFFEVLPTPIIYNNTDTSITQIITDFDKYKRTALVVFHSNENSTSRMTYDLESGILLDAQSSAIITIKNQPELISFSNKLSFTNMINSDSSDIQATNNTISIPSWIKNTSKWWSQGQIQDTDFIKAIQYLISNGIMQVPHGSSGTVSSQQIPSWIKKDAGWWADGTISDDEFVKGIQWLITNGVIVV